MQRLACLFCLAAFPALAQLRLEVTSPLGTKFYSLADDKGVIPQAGKALAADPKNAGLMLKLAQAQISVWQDREAVETLTRALKIKPNDAALLTERGHRELPLREFARAAADLSQAVALAPNRMDAYYHLGLAHFFQGQFSEAADAFRQAVAHAPNTDEVINSTNWVYAASRRAGQSAEAARAIAAIQPGMKNDAPHTLHYLNLVRLFQGAMTVDAALPPQPPAGNTNDEPELAFDTVSFGIGNKLLADGDKDRAQAYFERVLKGHVWVTWGFIGSEVETAQAKKKR